VCPGKACRGKRRGRRNGPQVPWTGRRLFRQPFFNRRRFFVGAGRSSRGPGAWRERGRPPAGLATQPPYWQFILLEFFGRLSFS
jgi:hypothetical protein